MMIRAFFKDSAIYALPALVSRGLSLFLVPLYTRVLSPGDYGSLDLLTVFASIINLTIALEVSQGLARYYTGESDSDRKVSYASTAFCFTFFCYSVFALLASLFAPCLAHFIMGQAGLEVAFRLGIALIWSNGLFYLIQNQFRWELRSRNYAIVSLLMSFTTAASTVWFAFFFRWGLEGMLLGMVTGSLAGTILGLWLLRNSFRFRFNYFFLRDMLAFSTPLVFSGVAVWISLYIDRVMINRLLSVEAVGLYGIGYRVASIASLVMVGFQGALTPLVYAHCQDPETPGQLAKIFRIFMLFALFIYLILSLFAQDIVRLLTTEQFFGGATVVIYLVPAVLLSNMYIFAPGISIAKKTHLMIWINFGGALVNIFLNFILIPVLGIIGAGLATLFSSFVVFTSHMVMSQKLFPVPHKFIHIILSTSFAFFLSYYINQFSKNNFTINILTIIIFVIGCIVFKIFKYSDFQDIFKCVCK